MACSYVGTVCGMVLVVAGGLREQVGWAGPCMNNRPASCAGVRPSGTQPDVIPGDFTAPDIKRSPRGGRRSWGRGLSPAIPQAWTFGAPAGGPHRRASPPLWADGGQGRRASQATHESRQYRTSPDAC